MPGVPFLDLDHKSIEELFQLPSPKKYNSLKSSKIKRRWILAGGITLVFLCALMMLFHFFKDKNIATKPLTYLKGSCPDFSGRKEYLDLLYNELIHGKNNQAYQKSTLVKVLWGKGGFGKSELAIEFANRYLSHFSLVWTFFCDSQENLNQGYRDLADNLGILRPADSEEKIKETVHFYLENHSFSRPWLLIFDNVENEFTSYPQRGGAILVTSQKKVLNPNFLLEILPFSTEESLELLEKTTQENRSADMELLIQDLDSIPFLVSRAAQYIKATPGCKVSDYQKIFSSYPLVGETPFWKDQDVNRRYSKNLSTSWQFSLNSLKKENPLAEEWLSVCSYLYPEHIPEKWIDDWLNQKKEGEKKGFALQEKEILKSLVDYGIARYHKETKTFSIHRFYPQMIRNSRQDHREEDLTRAVLLLETHARDYSFFETASWEPTKYWYLQACEVRKWLRRHPSYLSDPVLNSKKASLYEGMGLWCIFNYRYVDAIEILNEAIDLRKLVNSSEVHISCIRNYIGWSLGRLGRCTEGLRVYKEAEDVLQNHIKEAPFDYGDTLNCTGLIYYYQGEFEKSYAYHVKAHRVFIEQPGKLHPGVGYTLNNLGRCLMELGRYQEALDSFDQAVEAIQKACGKKHPYTTLFQILKAEVMIRQQEYKQALKFLERVIAEYHSTKIEELVELYFGYYEMGVCHLHLHHFKKARRLFKQAIDEGSKHFLENTLETVASYQGIGWSYLREGKTKKGFKYLIKQLELGEKLYKMAPKRVVPMLEDLQQALADAKNDEDEIVKLAAKKGYEISREILAQEHPLTMSLKKCSRL